MNATNQVTGRLKPLRAAGRLALGMGGGAFGARYSLGSDRMYERGRKSYYEQMKDPETRRNFLESLK